MLINVSKAFYNYARIAWNDPKEEAFANDMFEFKAKKDYYNKGKG
jgi:hypothetical protein